MAARSRYPATFPSVGLEIHPGMAVCPRSPAIPTTIPRKGIWERPQVPDILPLSLLWDWKSIACLIPAKGIREWLFAPDHLPFQPQPLGKASGNGCMFQISCHFPFCGIGNPLHVSIPGKGIREWPFAPDLLPLSPLWNLHFRVDL